MSREFNHPDLENPPYCKVVIEFGETGSNSAIIKGFHSIRYCYPDEPSRLSVFYSEPRLDTTPTKDGSELHEQVFPDAEITEVLFEDEWEYDVQPILTRDDIED